MWQWVYNKYNEIEKESKYQINKYQTFFREN